MGDDRQAAMQDSDAALATRVATGDERAFSLLVSRHLERVRAIAHGYLGSRADADDVSQDVFMSIWKSAHRFDPSKAEFSTWLYRIVANRCIDHRRKRRWFGFAAIDDHAETLPGGSDTLATVVSREGLRMAREAIRALPERQRMALLLSVSAGLANPEIAETLGISRGAVEQLLVRARSTLRVALDGDTRR